MCGINCILKFDNTPVDKSDLLWMNKMILHRGPDFQNVFTDNYLGFGHCRLSIIDLSNKANQPMSSYDNRYIIVYNGEVYNFRELRQQLLKRGYKFKSKSDTEVVLNSYIEWREKIVNKLNGMFAILIWDKKKKELFVTRDRFGIKPLYYSINEKRLIISSEIKSMEKFVKLEINKNSLIEYFLMQNYLDNKTMYKNIFLVEKGCFMIIKKNKIKKKKYFNPRDLLFKSSNINDNSLEKLLDKSVKKQLVSDVPLASYLSSGIDSSLLSYFISNTIVDLQTFTCGFLTNSKIPKHFDESNDADLIAKKLNVRNKSILFDKKNLDEDLKILFEIIEEPRLGFSLPNLKIAQFIKKNNYKVVISGAGGDEMFGGYQWRYKTAFLSKNKNEFIKNFFTHNFRFNIEDLNLLFSPIKSFLKKEFNIKTFNTIFKYLNKNSKQDDFIKSCFLYDINYFLESYCILEDKISMSQSIETRVPFLENELSEFALNLKIDKKVSLNKNNNELIGKLILKELAKNKLPNKIIKKKKQGFSAPYEYFLSNKSEIIKKIFNKNCNIYNFIDYNYVNKRIVSSLNNRNDRSFIWSVISFYYFLRSKKIND